MLAAAEPAWGTLAALGLFILASMWIGVLANRAMREGSFLKGFFLGNRGLGSWALALTATVQSGGTFMGFPSLVYSHGWSVALWIASYMVVPITGFAVLGKRLAQISRRCGAITMPDLFRERFGSAALGLVASLFILFYMSFMMVAQFKAGALVMKISWAGTGNWSEDQNAGRYRITEASLARLAQTDTPPQVVDGLKPFVGRLYADERQLSEDVQKTLKNAKVASGEADTRKLLTKIAAASELTDWPYIVGLMIFTVSVVGYTLIGGFLAAVWTDLFQSVMMWFGVIIFLVLALRAVDLIKHQESVEKKQPAIAQMNSLEYASRRAVEKTSADFAYCPGYDGRHEGRTFLPLGLAFSFFWIWTFAGLSSPAGVVRVMACQSTTNIRRSIYLLGGYNAFIYIPLVVICICARSLIPDLPVGKTDDVVPLLAMKVTSGLPLGQFIGGLILAAPFGAVMATVSCYLVVIASGLVRDVYQRFLRPAASQLELERLSHLVMIVVGAIAVLANIRPVDYLQAIVVFSGTGAGATFCVPLLMLVFWRRATVPGMFASMLGGAGTMLVLYWIGGVLGYGSPLLGAATSFRPYFLLGIDPLIWSLAVSFVAGIAVSLATRPCDDALLAKYFDAECPDTLVPVLAVNPAEAGA
ncbi:MAG TPA: sodium:solute symporter [Planctomycetaceae bacterium]|jgi:SSS family solute:Na+ symporter/sodium/pantothenate symporter|nr:sodium:solute symporter [Planctomycetaceae bacterium]